MLKIPIRTCVVCRDKHPQKLLNRLQCKDKKLNIFNGNGRSFYICESCFFNEKQLEKALYRYCKNKDKYIEQLKEILGNGRQS
ncbi:MAG: DUF448 domain-containing protein [Campylobacterota bacterium]|nr:DUF448 domain-containing protein [Campylobacterota bacterium]